MRDPEKELTKNVPHDEVDKSIVSMMKDLDDIYKNKSSDEYKMAGDITKSPIYEKIESLIADLRTLKGLPKTDAEDYQQLFNALHKPMYRNMTAEYLKKPNEKNTLFVALFTVGYRTLVGDLSRIYAATEATPNGFVYHSDQAAKQRTMTKSFIKAFNKNMDEEYNKAIRSKAKKPTMHQEGALLNLLGAGTTALATLSRAHELGPITAMFRDIFNFIFGAKRELNPVSFMGHHLTRSYDGLVHKFEDTEKMYRATKEAYEEYKNSPGRKDPRIEQNYERNLKKYNITMKTLQAKMDHFDARAQEEAKAKAWEKRQEDRKKLKAGFGTKQEESKPKPSSPFSPKPKPTLGDTTEKPKPPKVDTGDLDF